MKTITALSNVISWTSAAYLALSTALVAFGEESVHGRNIEQKSIFPMYFLKLPVKRWSRDSVADLADKPTTAEAAW